MTRHRDSACVSKTARGSFITAAVLGAALVSFAPKAHADQPYPSSQPAPYNPSTMSPGSVQTTPPSATTPGSVQATPPSMSPGSVQATPPSATTPSVTTPSVTTPETPSATTPSISTTQTTAAEYVESPGAERVTTTRPNRPMLISGATLLVGSYAAGVIVAATSDLDADKKLYIPVVGPWLDLGQRPCSFGSDCSTSDNIGSALLIGSGVAQGLGVILTAASFATPERHVTSAPLAAQKPQVAFSPVSYNGGGGLGATGRF